MSNEGGAGDVFVRPFPGPGGKWLISTAGGIAARWSPDGRELYFLAPGGQLMVVDCQAKGDSFTAGQPRPWSDKAPPVVWAAPALDGKRFLIAKRNVGAEAGSVPTHVNFLLNFADELRRKVPAGK